MTRTVHMEWTKLRTVPSTAWLAVALVASTVLLSVGATASVHTEQCPSPGECFEDTTKLSLTGVWLGQVVVSVLAVLAMTNEYATRLIQSTLAMVPSRGQVLAAKAVTVTAMVTCAASLSVAGSLIAGRAILPSHGFTTANGYPPLSLADGPTLRAGVGTVLYLVLIGLFSLSIGAIIRDTAAAITTVLTIVLVVPLIAQSVSDPRWSEALRTFSPADAGLAIQSTTALDRLPVGPWAGLGVLAAYTCALTLGATVLFSRRDA